MSAPHTPGPWKNYGGEITAGEHGDLYICECPTEANARLIAAAPCMAGYIAKRADAGDPEAIALMERINGRA